MNELLITGIPRSGTTLTTAIVDGLENTLALSEPSNHTSLLDSTNSAAEYVHEIYRDLKEKRLQYLRGLPINDRRYDTGEPLTNYFTRSQGAVHSLGKEIPLDKPGLSADFLLASKHNAHYTAVLPSILHLTDLSVIAVIRHPIPTILSWRSLQLPVSKGRLPAGERYWKELRMWIDQRHSLMTTQVGIYELFCQRYLTFGDKIKLIRYEDLVSDEYLLARFLGRSVKRRVEIQKPNLDNEYPVHEIDEIRRILLEIAPCSLDLYPDLVSSFNLNQEKRNG
jgi:hypothetical protein